MARTDRFRQQHVDLLSMATQLQSMLNPTTLVIDAVPARSLLSKLMAGLILHLGMEDKILYPELLTHKEPRISAISKQFSHEMKSMTGIVDTYNKKWATPSLIKADAAGFVRESKVIINTLANRIKRENTELYAIADKIQGNIYL